MMVLTLLVGGPALAAAESPPLLVAAEIDPGLGVDAKDVRSAIGAELHRAIAAPAAAPSFDVADVLLVSMSRSRTVVSFRSRGEDSASRAIPTPEERVARLRAVAWLAGNLARDQVSPLVLAEAAEKPEKRPSAWNEAPASAPSTAPPPAVVPPTPGPVMGDESTQLRRTGSESTPPEPTWRVSLAGGAAMENLRGGGAGWSWGPVYATRAWQLEVQHRQATGWLLGGALDYGPNAGNGLGYAATVGIEQSWRRFRFEESLGLGLEPGSARQSTVVTNSSLTGQNSETTVSSSLTVYSRGFLTATYPLSRSWDLLARVGAHFNLAGPVEDTLLVTSVGVRLRLP